MPSPKGLGRHYATGALSQDPPSHLGGRVLFLPRPGWGESLRVSKRGHTSMVRMNLIHSTISHICVRLAAAHFEGITGGQAEIGRRAKFWQVLVGGLVGPSKAW